jgi:hypothetical protein
MYNRKYDLHRRHESRQGLSLRREALECDRPSLWYAAREDHPGVPHNFTSRLKLDERSRGFGEPGKEDHSR